MNTNPQRKSIIVFASLALMMALALVLRLAGIGKESLWWDEYTSHVYLNAPSLYDFLVLNRTLDPLTLPFYYTLEYLWTHYVHDSVLSLRLMSIAIGIATIPLLYALGRRLFGTWAGLTAAALLAVSPTHIHHSQSIRMYVVFIFLAAVVAWTFVRLLEKSRLSLWALHGAASFLLYWTHPFEGWFRRRWAAFCCCASFRAAPFLSVGPCSSVSCSPQPFFTFPWYASGRKTPPRTG